jgi:epidermal growth factor receptor substrate 15
MLIDFFLSQGDIPPVMAVQNSVISPPPINSTLMSSDWAVKPAEKVKYDQLFESLQPHNGMIPGNKVCELLFPDEVV